jgi:amidase
VRDSAILLAALTGADPRDSATERSSGKLHADYTKFLDADALRGARLGVARRYFRTGRAGTDIVESAIRLMEQRGAVIVELTDQRLWSDFGEAEHKLMLYEFKAGLNAYFASLGPNAPVKTLEDVIAFNIKNKDRELPFFGQEIMLAAQEMGPLTEPAYLDAVDKARRLSRAEGIDAVVTKHQLDAIVAPSGGPAGTRDPLYGDRDSGGSSSPAAVAGYPNITVPAGQVSGLPVGISFFGPAFNEPKLLALASSFEHASAARKPPRLIPTIG